MTAIIAALGALYLLCLAAESVRARRARRVLAHVVHVNGTRGKSSVSRLIDAGLRAGGLRVFCKTTGTDPMTIDTEDREEPIVRRGRANIREQLTILHRAAAQRADILVVECMAVLPELQYAAQHRILRADIGVITNVRRDHTDVMGETLPQIAASLANTVPQNGVLFTAERGQAEVLARRAEALGSRFVPVAPDGTEPEIDFAENVALALAVCAELGVPRETALAGMRRFRRDPYALSLYRCGKGGVFVNGLSINDVQSTCMVWEELRRREGLEEKELFLLVNNRPDRPSRTRDMLELCLRLRPQKVFLLGASQRYLEAKLRRLLPQTETARLKNADALALSLLTDDRVLFAVGNLAGEGRALLARVRKEGETLAR